jgi:hypothetical protein
MYILSNVQYLLHKDVQILRKFLTKDVTQNKLHGTIKYNYTFCVQIIMKI